MRNIIASSTFAATAGACGILAGAIIATPQGARAQQNDPICLTTESGAVNCSFRSMSQCLQARTGSTDDCGINPEIGGTVGLGGRPADGERYNGAPMLQPAQPLETR